MPGIPTLDGSTLLVLLLAGTGVALLSGTLLTMLRRDRSRHGAAVRRLGRGLGLSIRQRRLLWALSRGAGLTSPVGLLLSRGCYDMAVARYAEHPGDDERLQLIRQKVFRTVSSAP